MNNSDFELMTQHYTLIPMTEARNMHPTVPWMGTLRGFVMKRSNGDLYDGDWSVHRTKSVFRGKFMFHGYGIYLSAADEKYYVGNFQDSQYHGHGRYAWLTTSKAWKKNRDTTIGVPFNGKPFTYDGNFVYNVRHGPALVTFKDGATKHTIWSHDRLQCDSISVYCDATMFYRSLPSSPDSISVAVNTAQTPKSSRVLQQPIISPALLDRTPVAHSTRNALKRSTSSSESSDASSIKDTNDSATVKDRQKQVMKLRDDGLITDAMFEILQRDYASGAKKHKK